MNGPEDSALAGPSPANDNAARVIAYLGPYLFWGTVGTISLGIFLLA